MNIHKATREYEAWLGERTTLVQADLDYKHAQMTTGALPFLRATFYHWAQIFPALCPAQAEAPILLAVGDLHLENFGTWRDADGRLAWGINDFDEAQMMPYTGDLVRLAVSADLADGIACKRETICAAILDGYTAGLSAGGKPFVLAEENAWLREAAGRSRADPAGFWKKMAALPDAEAAIPLSAREGIEHLLPHPRPPYRVVSRRAGLGSLGHRRFVGLAEWAGGQVARQAKAVAPSAWLWAKQETGPQESLYQTVLTQAMRSRDPYFEVRGEWILRRLAPDCTRVPLAALAGEAEEVRLLRAMGWETANVHLSSPAAVKEILRDAGKRPRNWLLDAVEVMSAATWSDAKAWKKETERKEHE